MALPAPVVVSLPLLDSRSAALSLGRREPRRRTNLRSYFHLPGHGKDPPTEGGHSKSMSEMPAHQNRDVANRYRQANPERLSEELLGDLFAPGAVANNDKHNLQQE